MTRYHLNPESGIPNRCTSEDSCPVGRSDAEHYASREEAFNAFEQAKKPSNESKSLDGLLVLNPNHLSYAPNEITVTALSPEILVGPDEALLPPGEYWFGDPCYAAGIDNKAWQEWVQVASDSSNGFADNVNGAFYGEYPVVAANTLYGDGVYLGSNGFSYGVDAGCLGVVPAKLTVKMGINKSELNNLGTWVTIEEETKLSRNIEGLIKFGDLTVDTGDNTSGVGH